MIFKFENYCALAGTFEEERSTPFLAGEEGMLSVALVSSGACGSGAFTPAAQAGTLLVWCGALQLLPKGPTHVAWVCFTGAAAQDFAAGLAAPLAVPATHCSSAPETLYRLLAGGVPPAQASALGYSLLCALAAAKAGTANRPALVEAAAAQMRKHYAEVYGIEELAAQLGVSKSHLVRSFSAAVGMPPGKYLTAVRLDAAKQLLLHRDYTLDVIATLCGFSGANYLCKVFKRETGFTPAQWRRKNAPHATAAPGLIELERQLYL